MKERPIIFSGEMVKALLDGRKTQTRRVIGVRNTLRTEDVHRNHNDEITCVLSNFGEFWSLGLGWKVAGIDYSDAAIIRCPYGQVGQQLWVRETWCPVNDEQFGGEKWIDYRATPRYEASRPAGWENSPDDIAALKWRPSIFMPRWASRITLEITAVRVERVQDISVNDCLAEGLIDTGFLSTDYAHLWDSINAKRGYPWESNPWVFVIEFRKVAGNR